MATVSTLNEERKVDDPVNHVRRTCLGTPVILRRILQQFFNCELVKLSLVSKQWNVEARSLLRDRGTLTAKVYSQSHSTCKYLGTFASDLRQMPVVPFAAIDVLVNHTEACPSASSGSSDPSYNVLLERLPFKTLSVEFYIEDWDKCWDCPAIALVKRILKEFCGVLEKLSIKCDLENEDLLQHVVRGCSFPRLKILKFEFEEDCDEDFTNFVKTMVSLAPSLLELRMKYLSFNQNVLEGSSAVLVPSHFDFNPLNQQVSQSVIGMLRPEIIQIEQRRVTILDPEILQTRMPMVLQASRTALKILFMDLLVAIPLMCYGLCLENVTTLGIRMEGELFQGLPPRLLTLLKGFDFSRVFPKLTKVSIYNSQERSLPMDQIRVFFEQGHAALQSVLADGAINIKHLELHDSVMGSFVPFLAEMFPDITTLSVSTMADSSPVPFTLLWQHFKYLEELEVVHSGDPDTVANLDSVICGIFPEEVAELRKKDVEYLKAVKIVPVMPSIACMKELKKCTFRNISEPQKLKNVRRSLMYSIVSILIGFARCPNRPDVAFETAYRPEVLKTDSNYVWLQR